jgi:carboxyl-terminal processing protease
MQGMSVLILDLRGNPGGYLDAAVQLADRFVVQGTLASTRGQAAEVNRTYEAMADRDVLIPLVLLVDRGTASASEVFAGTLKQLKRATLVGERTFGKGTVQYVFPLRTLAAGLRLTAARYLLPYDLMVTSQGIQPDVLVDTLPMPMGEVPMSMLQLEEWQLEVALQTARKLSADKP